MHIWESSLGLPGRTRLAKKALDGPGGGGDNSLRRGEGHNISGLAWAEGLGGDLGLFAWGWVH